MAESTSFIAFWSWMSFIPSRNRGRRFLVVAVDFRVRIAGG